MSYPLTVNSTRSKPVARLGRVGDGVDRMQDRRAAPAPDREAALAQRVEVRAARDERDRVAALGERRAVEAAHGAGAHHEHSHG